MEFSGKSVVVTGGAQGIGKCIAECFAREGATVHVIDVQDGPWFVGDLADKATLAGGQTVRRMVKWFFRDVIRPSLDSRPISAESALRSTQR